MPSAVTTARHFSRKLAWSHIGDNAGGADTTCKALFAQAAVSAFITYTHNKSEIADTPHIARDEALAAVDELIRKQKTKGAPE